MIFHIRGCQLESWGFTPPTGGLHQSHIRVGVNLSQGVYTPQGGLHKSVVDRTMDYSFPLCPVFRCCPCAFHGITSFHCVIVFNHVVVVIWRVPLWSFSFPVSCFLVHFLKWRHSLDSCASGRGQNSEISWHSPLANEVYFIPIFFQNQLAVFSPRHCEILIFRHLTSADRYDYVEVYDGNNAEGKLLGRYCGNEVRHLFHLNSHFSSV